MAILVDYSQIFLSQILANVNRKYSLGADGEYARDLIINSLRSYNQKHKAEYGDMIIACDSRRYWRKEIFPYYKHRRKEDRAKSNLDWEGIFKLLEQNKEDLKNYFPYPLVSVDGAEADDVIAVLARKIGKTEKTIIISGDGDFIQLQENKNISQYSPILKRFLVSEDPKKDLLIKVMKGDPGDGIPNIMSKDNCFADKIRMTSLGEKKINFYLNSPNLYFDPESAFEGEIKRNFQRNKKLIDLSEIPDYIIDSIELEYDKAKAISPGHSKLRNYFMKNKMKNFMSCINDF